MSSPSFGGRRRRPRSRLPAARGYSLLEILVVLAIIALISGVIALVLMKHLEEARVKTTRESAKTLRTAVSLFKMDHPSDECPSVETLLQTQAIDAASKTTDAWDRAFVIECDERGGIAVASSGPDKRFGSPDDIRVPEPPKPVAER